MHLSDLHLGKRLKGYSLIEDQEFILKTILKTADEEQPDAVIIAGDVYDKTVPPSEAVELFDSFIVKLAERKLPTFIISGNHDSPERLAFGEKLIALSGIHISPVYNGIITPVALNDSYGSVNFYMLPYLKPVHVRQYFPDKEINSYTDALRAAVEEMNIDTNARNVLITHQFITGAEVSESEELAVGGTENVDASVFDGFDYVALGHIHRPQNMLGNRMRYCGTPLKYSLSEAKHNKSITFIELEEKGSLKVYTAPLVPLRDIKEIKGSFEELTSRKYTENDEYQKNYLHITLTDENDIPEATGRLHQLFPYVIENDYYNSRTRSSSSLSIGPADTETKSPLELFAEFYKEQNGAEMTDEQSEFVKGLIENIWEEI